MSEAGASRSCVHAAPGRMLVVLHEETTGSHADSRRALAGLKSDGALEDYVVYPFLARLAEGAAARHVHDEIVTAAADLRATCVLWCHTGRFVVPERVFLSLRGLPHRPVQGYWEGDMYESPFKPFPHPARVVARSCDVVFVPGASSFSRSLGRWGCADVRYAPSPTDPGKFGHAFELRRGTYDHDVVLIGNRVWSRVPFKTMPGARRRARLVRLLERKLGRRFAVYGAGWRGPSAQGPVRHDEQGVVYARSRMSVGVNNLAAAYCFSSRLPISLTCGVTTIHNWERGLDVIFGRDAPIRYFRSAREAWNVVRRLLEVDDRELEDERVRGRELALARFTFAHVLGYVGEVLDARWAAQQGGVARPVLNPWLGREHL